MPRFLYCIRPARPGQLCVLTSEVIRIHQALGSTPGAYPSTHITTDTFVEPATLDSDEARVSRSDLLAGAGEIISWVAREWPSHSVAELRAKGLIPSLD